MRTLYLFTMVTVDGFFEGPGHSIDWHTVDSEFNDFAVEQLCRTDLLLFGRRTFELMASYWPHYEPKPTTPENARTVGRLMNSIPRIVASRTMTGSSWPGTSIIRNDVAGEVRRLKQEPGEEIGIFGSSTLAASLHEVIDEYRIMISPVLLGAGTPLFTPPAAPAPLSMITTRTFGNGNVLLTYARRNR